MARRHHYKRRSKPAYEPDVTTFLNLMVVLVPFLLITAVFSRLTIVVRRAVVASTSASNLEYSTAMSVVPEKAVEAAKGSERGLPI